MSRPGKRRQAAAVQPPKIAFFFKQWGGVRKAETGRELDGETYDEFPESSAGVHACEFRRRLAAT